MGRSKRSKNKQKNMRFAKKNSSDYQEKARLKLQNKVNRKMEKRYLIGIYDSYRTKGKYNKIISRVNSKFIGSYSTQPFYTMYDLGMDDGIIVNDGNHSIKVEVWEISETSLTLIKMDYGYYDELPNDQNVYLKQKVLSPFGEIILFVYNDSYDDSKIVTSGDWIEYLNEKVAKQTSLDLSSSSNLNFVRQGFDKIIGNHAVLNVDKEFMD